MNSLKYWIAFSKQYVLPPAIVRRLWEYFGSIKEVWHATNADLLKCVESLELEELTYHKIQSFVKKARTLNPDDLLKQVQSRNIQVITLEDEKYPYLLKQIYDPPVALYIMGNLDICNLDKTLAIVGSRNSSQSIKDILNKIIGDLRGQDITVVSGMALGVDAYAHSAALQNNIKTIAVLGSGLDFPHPKTNYGIFKNIINGNGAVITEYFPTEPPEPWKFPYRNRIISGLSKGTLIAEAGLKSGALITAKTCLDQNRELMCIPGQITNPNTEGIHKLLKEGAGVVTCADDILNYLNWSKSALDEKNSDHLKIELLDNEKKIYQILRLEPKQFDDILNQSGLSINEVMVTLTTMEINGIIKQLPGQRYMLI